VAHKLSWFSTDHVGVLLPKIKKKSPKYQRTVGYPSTSWASCLCFTVTTVALTLLTQ